MEAKVNLPVPIEKYGFKQKRLKYKWMKEVRRIRKKTGKATYVLKKGLS